jgi:anion-transporting  ArsA/GET3 family ATPase
MNKSILTLLLLFFSGCTVYTEKQSEALSRSVYASKDSVEAARFDLTEQYVNESTRLVKPPKNRIEIGSIYKSVSLNTKPDPSFDESKEKTKNKPKQRVLIIPEKFKNDNVVAVNSQEYDTLLKSKEIYDQLEKDHSLLVEEKKNVDKELTIQLENRDKMVRDLNELQRKIAEKDLALMKRNIVIFGLVCSIGAAIFLRIKGIL